MKPRIRIKYCGGCNPGYDRIRVIEYIKIRLKDDVEWVSSETEPYDRVISIQGCETSCADLKEFKGREVYVVTCFEDADTLCHCMTTYNDTPSVKTRDCTDLEA